MTTTTAIRALTVRDVARLDLRDQASAPLDWHIERVVAKAGDQNRLDSVTRHSLDGQVRAALAGALNQDVVSILGAAWQASDRLRAAGYATAAQPGTRQIIRLVSQTCSHSIRPTVIVRLDGWQIAEITVTITVDVTFCNLAVAVSAGAIVAFEFGQCDIYVSIESGQPMPPLLSRSMPVTSNVQLPLTQPIPLPRQHRRQIG